MDPEPERPRPLRDIEMEVMAEGREWTRKRHQQGLQEEADRQGDPVEFGRRLHWEALHGGFGRARARLVVGDGAPWLWNVAQDRWQGATELLDFYHASEHLWGLGRALNKDAEAATAQWADPLRPPTAARGAKRKCWPR